MIYPANFESRVGFDRIREQIVAAASMSSSRERIAQESFCRSRREVEERLELADQMRQLIMMESGGDIGEQEDIAQIIEKVAVEGKKKKELQHVVKRYTMEEVKYTKEYLDYK